MMNFRANQLTEMVPVERIDAELGRYIKAGATNYMLLNTSDIRPVSMTIRAVMDLSWQGLTPDSDAGRFYRRWSADEFGEKAADTVAAIYKDYFDTPAQSATQPAREYGDQYYHTQARLLMLSQMVAFPLYNLPGQSPVWTPARALETPVETGGPQRLAEIAAGDAERCRKVQPKWDALWSRAVAAEKLVTPDRQPFYRSHVLAMIAICKESNRILTLAAEAVQQAIAGNRESARASVQKAIQSISEIRQAEERAEYGKWKNWYRGDWLTNVGRTAELLGIFLKQIDDPLSPLPLPVRVENWEAYHHIMGYEGTRTVDLR
jgi:hypothetical protein